MHDTKPFTTVRELLAAAEFIKKNTLECELDNPIIICNDLSETYEFGLVITQDINGTVSITVDPNCDEYPYYACPVQVFKDYQDAETERKFKENRDMRIAIAEGRYNGS